MHKLKKAFTTLVFVVLFTGCSLSNPQNPQELSDITWSDLKITPRDNNDLCKEIALDEAEWERSKQDFTYGLLGEISPESPSDPSKLADRTAWVSANEQQVLRWRLWYPEGNDRPVNLRLLVLLDERQLDNALPQPGLYNDIDLERGDEVSLKVTIPPIKPGVHDVITIGIPYPEEYPNEYGIVVLVYWRITLIADSPSSFREVGYVSLPAEGLIKKNDPLLTLELTLKNNGIDVWNWPDPWLHVHTNTSTAFYALTGHQDVTNVDAPPMDPLDESFFAILLFVDYQQIEVAPDQMVFYGRTDKDTAYGRIPLEVPPLSEGKHHILVLRIDTPGVPFCLLHGEPKGRILPNSIYGKLVGIEVLSSR